MSLECIYVTRHGFRSNWVVNPATGDYTAFIPSPTGIAADPALTAHGVAQARELAAHLGQFGAGEAEAGARRLPPVERVYCSPWYRCLQTVQPFVEAAAAKGATAGTDTGAGRVRCEPGLVDWFGPAPFEQPQPAPVAMLRQEFFPWIDAAYRPAAAAGVAEAVPGRHGESMAQLHARVAAALGHIVRQSDAEGVRAVLVCSHAAPIIAMGRALTGRVPADVEAEDFGAFTCGLSVFRRRRRQQDHQEHQQEHQEHQQQPQQDDTPTVPWDDQLHTLAGQTWTGGRGVAGGWDCEVNCDCSFLSGGEERGWRFSGDDESFAGAGAPAPARKHIVDAGLGLGVVVEGGRRRAGDDGDDGEGGGGGGSSSKKGPSRL